jgi:hypothetical protein
MKAAPTKQRRPERISPHASPTLAPGMKMTGGVGAPGGCKDMYRANVSGSLMSGRSPNAPTEVRVRRRKKMPIEQKKMRSERQRRPSFCRGLATK